VRAGAVRAPVGCEGTVRRHADAADPRAEEVGEGECWPGFSLIEACCWQPGGGGSWSVSTCVSRHLV